MLTICKIIGHKIHQLPEPHQTLRTGADGKQWNQTFYSYCTRCGETFTFTNCTFSNSDSK